MDPPSEPLFGKERGIAIGKTSSPSIGLLRRALTFHRRLNYPSF